MIKKLDELKAANLPRLNWRDIFEIKEPLTQAQMAEMDAYFSKFSSDRSGFCISCGAQQGGEMIDVFLGKAKFQWGLAHGEGFCSAKGCGYPARAYHFDVGPISFLNMILQYHPDELTLQIEATTGLVDSEHPEVAD